MYSNPIGVDVLHYRCPEKKTNRATHSPKHPGLGISYPRLKESFNHPAAKVGIPTPFKNVRDC